MHILHVGQFLAFVHFSQNGTWPARLRTRLHIRSCRTNCPYPCRRFDRVSPISQELLADGGLLLGGCQNPCGDANMLLKVEHSAVAVEAEATKTRKKFALLQRTQFQVADLKSAQPDSCKDIYRCISAGDRQQSVLWMAQAQVTVRCILLLRCAQYRERRSGLS